MTERYFVTCAQHTTPRAGAQVYSLSHHLVLQNVRCSGDVLREKRHHYRHH